MKNKIDLAPLLYRLVFVPTCASCGERLPPIIDRDLFNHGIPYLCDKCMEKWQSANCYKPAGKCTCMPLKNTFAQPSIPSIFFYHPNQTHAESKVIYSIKHKKNRDLFRFLALEIEPSLKETLDVLDITVGDCIFTYIPRTKSALRKNGFDQGKYLAKHLCKAVGGQCALPLLTRVGGKEQKRLSKSERKSNVESAIFANTPMRGFGSRKNRDGLSAFLSGKTVILVDDIITTGASLSRAIKVLRKNGAKNVIVCAAARCEISKNKQGSDKK